MKSATTASLIPAFVALAISLLLFSPAWLDWPSMPILLAKRTPEPVRNSPLMVWANTRSGFFYCSDSGMFGNLKPGQFMTQTEALQEGYRPWSAHVCKEPLEVSQ